MYNKRKFNKINDKKVLHKVKKQWVTVSLALFMMIGGGAVASHMSASADQISNNKDDTNVIHIKNNQLKQNGTSTNISAQANEMHQRLLFNANNKAKLGSLSKSRKSTKVPRVTVNNKPTYKINNINQLKVNHHGVYHNYVYNRINLPFYNVRLNHDVKLYNSVDFNNSRSYGNLYHGQTVRVHRAFEEYGHYNDYLRYEIRFAHNHFGFITGNPDYVSYVLPSQNYKQYRHETAKLLRDANAKNSTRISKKLGNLVKHHNRNYRNYAKLYAMAFNLKRNHQHPVSVDYHSKQGKINNGLGIAFKHSRAIVTTAKRSNDNAVNSLEASANDNQITPESNSVQSASITSNSVSYTPVISDNVTPVESSSFTSNSQSSAYVPASSTNVVPASTSESASSVAPASSTSTTNKPNSASQSTSVKSNSSKAVVPSSAKSGTSSEASSKASSTNSRPSSKTSSASSKAIAPSSKASTNSSKSTSVSSSTSSATSSHSSATSNNSSSSNSSKDISKLNSSQLNKYMSDIKSKYVTDVNILRKDANLPLVKDFSNLDGLTNFKMNLYKKLGYSDDAFDNEWTNNSFYQSIPSDFGVTSDSDGGGASSALLAPFTSFMSKYPNYQSDLSDTSDINEVPYQTPSDKVAYSLAHGNYKQISDGTSMGVALSYDNNNDELRTITDLVPNNELEHGGGYAPNPNPTVSSDGVETGAMSGLKYVYNTKTHYLEFTSGIATSDFGLSDIHQITSIKFDSDVDMSHVTNMAGAFTEGDLQHIDLGNNFDTSHVTDMSGMFYNDSSLKTVNLGEKFNTSHVTNMNGMFENDNSLQSLSLPKGFDTSHVTNMSDMFYDGSESPNDAVSDDNNGLKTLTIMSPNTRFNKSAGLEDVWSLPNSDTVSSLCDNKSHVGTWINKQNLEYAHKYDTMPIYYPVDLKNSIKKLSSDALKFKSYDIKGSNISAKGYQVSSQAYSKYQNVESDINNEINHLSVIAESEYTDDNDSKLLNHDVSILNHDANILYHISGRIENDFENDSNNTGTNSYYSYDSDVSKYIDSDIVNTRDDSTLNIKDKIDNGIYYKSSNDGESSDENTVANVLDATSKALASRNTMINSHQQSLIDMEQAVAKLNHMISIAENDINASKTDITKVKTDIRKAKSSDSDSNSDSNSDTNPSNNNSSDSDNKSNSSKHKHSPLSVKVNNKLFDEIKSKSINDSDSLTAQDLDDAFVISRVAHVITHPLLFLLGLSDTKVYRKPIYYGSVGKLLFNPSNLFSSDSDARWLDNQLEANKFTKNIGIKYNFEYHSIDAKKNGQYYTMYVFTKDDIDNAYDTFLTFIDNDSIDPLDNLFKKHPVEKEGMSKAIETSTRIIDHMDGSTSEAVTEDIMKRVYKDTLLGPIKRPFYIVITKSSAPQNNSLGF